MAVAEASFSTSIEAMSSGFSSDIGSMAPSPSRDAAETSSDEPPIITPSITYKGDVPPLTELAPRTMIFVWAPGAPPVDTACTPGIRPARMPVSEVEWSSSSALARTDEMDPVRSLRREVP